MYLKAWVSGRRHLQLSVDLKVNPGSLELADDGDAPLLAIISNSSWREKISQKWEVMLH